MKGKREHRQMNWTAEDRARHKEVREHFQRERPSLDDLLASGECAASDLMTMGEYFGIQEAITKLKHERQQAGLSLTEVAKRSGIDRAALSRLENGRQPNPTLATLCRYATAVGKRILWVLRDLPAPKIGDEKKKTRSRRDKKGTQVN